MMLAMASRARVPGPLRITKQLQFAPFVTCTIAVLATEQFQIRRKVKENSRDRLSDPMSTISNRPVAALLQSIHHPLS